MNDGRFEELDALLEALCEERISAAEVARLEAIVLADRAAARRYVDYLHLHGTLVWDTAKGGEPQIPPHLAGPSAVPARTLVPPADGGAHRTDVAVSTSAVAGSGVARVSRRGWVAAVLAIVLLAALSIGVVVNRRNAGPNGPAVAVSPDNADNTASGKHAASDTQGDQPGGSVKPSQPDVGPKRPDQIAAIPGVSGRPDAANPSDRPVLPRDLAPRNTPENGNAPAVVQNPSTSPPGDLPHDPPVRPSDPVGLPVGALPVVAFVDAQLRESWEAESIQPSAVAEDAEWLRRVHLDLVGRIPTPAVVERAMRSGGRLNRAAVVDELLDDPSFIRHWTTLWTNLLVGRSTSQDAQRTALQKFLRDAFARNRAWNEVVFDLVSAEGAPEENGAAGFLLAHLNNEAVPATAITARVFLGTQVQCTQCHNHPFNDAKQNEFWELHSFFQQTSLAERSQRDASTGQMRRVASLATREEGGPGFFETRAGLMKAVFPKYGGEQVDPAPTVNRRRELARLLREDDDRQVARAFVNRLWEHFFGAAFTRPVDDMGTHNPPTHPAALDRLTDEFVASGYDAKQLMRWICATDAYQRTSRFSPTNGIDDPAVGNPPLFSRVYVKSMTAEQLYDSLLVATKADEAPKALRLDLDRQRDEWIQQFILDYATEENDEALTFDGTIPQALLLMNSELVTTAVSSTPGTLLHDVLHDKGTEVDKIRRLCLAALSRYPTSKEVAALRKMLRERLAKPARPQSRETLLAEGYQDVFWAFLNSNEFVLVP